jgi:hypothetical protein
VNKPETLITKNGVDQIILPEFILPVAVKDFASRVLKLTDPDKNVVHMTTTDNLFKDLQIAAAADFLGYTTFTQRMLNGQWKRLKSNLLTQANADVICRVDAPIGSKLLKIVAEDLAEKAWDEQLPNPVAFEQYLSENIRFGTLVHMFWSKWEAEVAKARGRKDRRGFAKERAEQWAVEQNGARTQ